jgi:hypothetical protein
MVAVIPAEKGQESELRKPKSGPAEILAMPLSN